MILSNRYPRINPLSRDIRVIYNANQDRLNNVTETSTKTKMDKKDNLKDMDLERR